jgi:hypothetical protein
MHRGGAATMRALAHHPESQGFCMQEDATQSWRMFALLLAEFVMV